MEKLLKELSIGKNKQVDLFTKIGVGGANKAERKTIALKQLETTGELTEEEKSTIHFDLELLKEAGDSFSTEAFLKGEITPAFFGSALTNFGLEPFFESFVQLAPRPWTKKS